MDTEHELAFLRGMRKRALEKEAFVGALVGGTIRALAPFALGGMVQKKLQSTVLPKLIAKGGFAGRTATKVNNLFDSNGMGGVAAHMALHSALSPVVDPAVNYVANKFDGQQY